MTVYISENTPVGTYRGNVTIDAGRAGMLNVPVELEVLDYALPLRGRLRTIFGFDWSDELVEWYGWDEPQFRPEQYKKIPQDWARQIWDMTLSYRIYAGGLYKKPPFPRKENLDFCLARGLNNYQIGLAESSGDPNEFLPRLREMAAFAEEKGIADISYVYGWDEYPGASQENFRRFLSDFRAVGREIPKISRCDVYSNPPPQAIEVLDIVVPLTPQLERRNLWESVRARGKVVGGYVCNGPLQPYANFFIDYPAIDQRIVFWQLYDYDATFFLHWMINGWSQSNHPDKRWPEGPWVTAFMSGDNGSGQLLYPAKTAVLPSVRLANIRDGIEDYEALAVLAELTDRFDPGEHTQLVAENQQLLSVPDEVSKSMTEYTNDPAVLLAARRRVDEQILKTKQLLSSRQRAG